MDELHRRFRRLDRVATPNLWNEAVARSVEVAPAPRWAFNPSAALIAVALMLAALGGTMAVGAWLDRQSPIDEIVTYDNGMIVSRVGCGGIVALDPTSLEQRQIAAGRADCWTDSSMAAWSQDGSLLAYLTATEGGQTSVSVYEPATGDTRQVRECDCEHVDISPDGSFIAFVEYEEIVVAAVGSDDGYSIPVIGRPSRAVFSPDGSRLAFAVLGGTSGVYVVDLSRIADGVVGAPTMIHGIVDAGQLAWSPDGRWIAMSQTGGLGRSLSDPERPAINQQITASGWGIVIARADGSEVRVLATAPSDAWGGDPTWAPDSASLAYAVQPSSDADTPDAAQVWTVTIDGGPPTLLYESACCPDAFSAPDWSPDGEWIAIGIEVTGAPDVSGTFLVRPDGSEARQVSLTKLHPLWQPIPKD